MIDLKLIRDGKELGPETAAQLSLQGVVLKNFDYILLVPKTESTSICFSELPGIGVKPNQHVFTALLDAFAPDSRWYRAKLGAADYFVGVSYWRSAADPFCAPLEVVHGA